ncbi:glial cell line-derived neurotrophic factor-like [Sphaerodactylus townsendi]|nr:glial cell line-derived neurotrophic factor-like [Sphaerodactylus townsendi]
MPLPSTCDYNGSAWDIFLVSTRHHASDKLTFALFSRRDLENSQNYSRSPAHRSTCPLCILFPAYPPSTGVPFPARTLSGRRNHKQADSTLFESYTEGEIRQLISTLIERYSQSMNSGGHELPLFTKASNRMKRAKARHKPCSLKELEVTVSELGLGYTSDETVLFRYCSGTCDSAVRNYDLSLRNVRKMKKIKKEKVRARPCCRPLAYDDDISFLDTGNRYYTVNEVSAKECGCI